ncbi:MAG: ribonuclease J [Clostridia bacterium]|nr:ribonuclease J [Clostridia bacterium]
MEDKKNERKGSSGQKGSRRRSGGQRGVSSGAPDIDTKKKLSVRGKGHGTPAAHKPAAKMGATREGQKDDGVKVMFFGGVGEIGKNMTAVECAGDIVIIDAGAIFPTEDTPGIDLVVPDITYLVENRDKIRALIITHGHEDHIGGVPYLLKEIKGVRIFGTALSLALIDNKLHEHRITEYDTRTVKAGDRIKIGVFGFHFINVTHSISGSLALDITTPQGTIFHSGDFKIDLTPVAGAPIDLKSIADVGEKGVMLYLGESTNIERPGYTMSEKTVGEALDRIFEEHSSRRIIIATFASNVHRIQQICDIAKAHGRVVALNGRSMLAIIEAAEKIKEITVPQGVLVDIGKLKNYKDSQIVIVSTGSQGEAMSGLTRMANGENRDVVIGKNDSVIISASPIPGNEKSIYKVINSLCKKGADVVYEALEHVHVSGHACREEHKIMHSLLRPKYFIPIHGEFRHQKMHARLAVELGMKEQNIFLAEIGSAYELKGGVVRRVQNIPAGSRLVDGEGIEDEKASIVVKDRKQLSEEGLFIVSVAVSNGLVLGEPVINSRGFVYDFHRNYQKEMRAVVDEVIENYDLKKGSSDELKKRIKRALQNYIFKKTRQSPMVVATVVEI